MSVKKKVVFFNKINITPINGEVIFDVYLVAENDQSIVMDNFLALDNDTQAQVIALVTNMATHEIFRSPQIKYNLKSYNYGEIRPKPHRFFFFQKCGKNYIFFDYILKKVNSLPDKIYKAINEKKVYYEKEFESFIKKNK